MSTYSAEQIETSIKTGKTDEVISRMNYDSIHMSPQEFTAVIDKMTKDGLVRSTPDGSGGFSQVTLKNGYFEFLGVGGTKVYDKNDVQNAQHLNVNAINRKLLGGLDTGAADKPKVRE